GEVHSTVGASMVVSDGSSLGSDSVVGTTSDGVASSDGSGSVVAGSEVTVGSSRSGERTVCERISAPIARTATRTTPPPTSSAISGPFPRPEPGSRGPVRPGSPPNGSPGPPEDPPLPPEDPPLADTPPEKSGRRGAPPP